jgi:hypothetical protein
MPDQCLFGHLIARFKVGPENLATESLLYVLDGAPVARRAFLDYLRGLCPWLGDDLLFRSQAVGADQAIPDLVGTDRDGRQPLIIEAKFWAGLTGHQPVTYLRRLPTKGDGVLLFLAPAMRFATLWPELARRCVEAGVPFAPQPQDAPEQLTARVGARHTLALVSWRAALAAVRRGLDAEGDHGKIADLIQLEGLCQTMDARAFLPLGSEELTGDVAARVVQYSQLADDLAAQLIAEGVASAKDGVRTLRSAGGKGWYGRYVKVGGFLCLPYFSAWKWRAQRATPLWFSVYGPNYAFPPQAWDRLRPLELETPPRLLRDGDELTVPLMLPLGVEREVVLRSLVEQVREIAGLLDASV